jgi:hypothetical protein
MWGLGGGTLRNCIHVLHGRFGRNLRLPIEILPWHDHKEKRSAWVSLQIHTVAKNCGVRALPGAKINPAELHIRKKKL